MTSGYLVDTDWAIHYLNGHPEIVTKLQLYKKHGLRLSVVSLAELYEGVYYSRNP
jgi:tRNA(fMet)-specific endonuclease VapC